VAIKSALNPGAIVNERPVSVSAATNFITGGSDLGQGVLSSAANKIVGFGRGTGTVAPKVPDLGSIINTLSTNILNNVEGKLQSINQNVVNIVNNTLKTISTDYKGKLAQLESDRPNNVLNNFLRLYKDALGFIQFLGNRKNIKTLGDNLEALRKVFQKTFDVAKVIRKTIIKIVEQLSNLPTASGSAGGLNLDVNIPGANVLGRAAPKGLASKFGKAALIGGGVVAAGALGSKVVSGMADVGGDVTPTPMGDQSGGLSGPILDKFNGILDKFSAAIANFKPGNTTNTKTMGTSTSQQTGDDQKTPRTDGKTPLPYAYINPSDIKADTPEAKAAIATIRQAEGTAGKDGYSKFFGGSLYGGDLTTKTVSEVVTLQKQFLAEGRGKYKGGQSAAVGAGQFMEPEVFTKSMGVDPSKQKFDEEFQNKLIVYYAKRKNIDLNKPLSKKDFDSLQTIWSGLGTYYNQTTRTSGQSFDLYKKNLEKVKQGNVQPGKVSAAPSQSTTAQEVSKQVAQTPGANQPAKSLIVPIDASSREQIQQNKPVTVTQRPVMSTQGTSIPNIKSTNGNNYLTLYSKLTYNIV
jgi:hypothetical protein